MSLGGTSGQILKGFDRQLEIALEPAIWRDVPAQNMRPITQRHQQHGARKCRSGEVVPVVVEVEVVVPRSTHAGR